MAHKLHGWSWEGALFCSLSNTSDFSPSALDPSCQPSQCPLPRTGRARPYPPLHHLPSQERGNFFSFLSLPTPSSTNSEGTFEDWGIMYKPLSHHLDNGEVFVVSQEARDGISKMLFPMKYEMPFQDGVLPFFPSPSPSVIQGLKWVYWFPCNFFP